MTGLTRFAFYGRVSTEDNQDPTLSLPRQLVNCEQAVGRVGGGIVAHFYDVESGANRYEARGSGRGLQGFEIPIPRDGGLLDLLEEARGRDFDAVVCESINRFSRNPSVLFRAEEELRDAEVKLWAADEPWEESFGSIVLRHVNVGLARGYLHELKIKSRQGIETAARQGRHPGGKPLYGYRFRELPHPNPHKASQGQRMRVLEPDPIRAPIVRMIFEDYCVRGLSLGEIEGKLNSDLDRFPPPESPDPKRRLGIWGRSSVWEVLHNPKYTGYQVWNRRQRKRGGKINPPERWVWSEAPAHEPLASKELFEMAQLIAGTKRNATQPAEAHDPYRRRSFALRSFVRCGVCGLRMQGKAKAGVLYYMCRTDQRPGALVPEGHPRTVHLREDWAAERVLRFVNEHLFGPDRLSLLTEILETDDPEAEQQESEIQRLRAELDDLTLRVKRQMANLEAEEPGTDAAREIRARLGELASLKAKKERQLKTAEGVTQRRADPDSAAGLLRALPVMSVDLDRLIQPEFRELLAAMRFEASYEPSSRKLYVRATLSPDILPSGVWVSSVPPVGFEPTL